MNDMRRMMENKYRSMMVKLLVLLTVSFLAVMLFGCNDPIVADMEAEHQRLGLIVKQNLQNLPTSTSTSPSLENSNSKKLYPAP
jgi:hypothetical protein